MPNVGNAWMPVVPTLGKGALTKISQDVQRELGGVGDKAGKQAGERFGKGLHDGMSGHLKKVAVTMGGLFAGDKAIEGLKSIVDAASETEQSVGAVQAVFKGSSSAIQAAAASAAKGLGISAQSYQEMAASLGAGLKNKGIKDYAAQTQTLIKTGADLSAQFGGSTKDAVEALGALMRGETDPVERYGIAINEDALKAEALSSGLIKANVDMEKLKLAQMRATTAQNNYNKAVKEHGANSAEAQRAMTTLESANIAVGKAMKGKVDTLTAEQKAQAALSLVQKQAADANGAFARENDTYAHKVQVLTATLDDYKAKLGAEVLPYAAKFAGFLVDKAVPAVQEFAQGFRDGTGKGGEFARQAHDLYSKVQPLISFMVDHKEGVAATVAAFVVAKTTVSSVNSLKESYDKVKSALDAAKGAASTFKSGLDAGAKIGSGGQVETFGEAMKAAGSKARTAAADVAQFVAAKGRATAAAAGDGIRAIGSSLASAGAAARTAAIDIGSAALAHARAGAAAALSAAQTLAAKGAQLAAAAGAKALAAGQWLVNAALSANPIGLVIAALVALGAGLVIAYQKSETFRNIVNGAWNGIKAAASSVVSWFQATAWPAMRSAFQWIGDKAKWLWTNGIMPAFNAARSLMSSVFSWLLNTGWPMLRSAFQWAGDKASWLWNTAIRPAFSSILATGRSVFGWVLNTGWPMMRTALAAIGDRAMSTWRSYISPAFEAIKRGAGIVASAFGTARDALGRAWEGIIEKIKGPIDTVLRFVQNNFVDKLNSMLGNKVLKDMGVDITIPSIPGYSAGGFVGRTSSPATGPGRSSGQQKYDRGGWTGPGPKFTPAGIVHADEFVIRKEAQNDIERANPGLLDKLNRHGSAALSGAVPGYAMGGKVAGLNSRFREALDRFADATHNRYSVISGLRTRTQQERLYAMYLNGTGNLAARPGTSRHESGNAADLSPSNARDVDGALAAQFGLHFPVPGEAWHIELKGNRGGPDVLGAITGAMGSAKDWVFEQAGKVLDPIKGQVMGLLDRIPGGAFGQIARGMSTKILEGALNKARELVGLSGGGAGGAFGPAGGAARWSDTAAQALQMAGLPSSLLPLFLHRINVESGGNPRAINLTDSNAMRGTPSKGLAQVIDPTFNAYAGSLRGRGVWDPLANLYASAMYTKSRYGVSGVQKAWGGRSGYAVGTMSAPPGMAWVGERGPELVDFKGGERVHTHDQSRQITRDGAKASGPTYIINAPRDRAEEIIATAHRANYRRQLMHGIA